MKFTELQKILNSALGVEKLADIARELDVTPQVVSNWKAKNNVPYKNVKFLRKKLNKIRKQNLSQNNYKNESKIENNDFEDSIHIVDIIMEPITLVIKHYILFSSLILSIMLIAVIHLKFNTQPVYLSHAKILPNMGKGNKSSNIGNIAAQFGFGSISSSETSITSSIMVPQIFKSRRLASELLNNNFVVPGQIDSINLASILIRKKVDLDTISQKQKYKLISKASKLIAVSENKKNPIIKISGSSFDGKFSKDIVDAAINRCIKIINEFKFKELEEKKSYIEKRLSEISSVLTVKEESLKSFREANRDIISSPSLILEQARLMRDVEVQNELYIRLKTEFELLQLEDVGAKNPIQILDFAEIPVKKTSPKPKQFLTVSFLFALLFSLGCVLLKDWLSRDDVKIILNEKLFFPR